MAKHAKLSASGASRWLKYTPSVGLEAGFPNKSSSYAEEGTAAHEVGELTARYRLGMVSAMDFENQMAILAKGKYFNAEMQECANDYASLICSKVNVAKETCEDALVELEVKLNFSKWVKDGFGTGDSIIVSDGWLEIIDLKYGKGYRVEAASNPQMRLYALGAIVHYGQLYDIENVRMTIYQPRLSGIRSEDEISVVDLLEWAEFYVKPRAELAHSGKGSFAPSEDTCKFCRAKEQCQARTEQNLKLFDDAPDILLITPAEAGLILQKAADIQAWLKDLENLVSKTLFSGDNVEGWKLVEGRSNRKYVDELKVVEAMKSAGYDETLLYERKLISLTQLEKDFGKKAVGETLRDLIVKPSGKPTLAPFKDKRPAIQLDEQLLAEFGEIEEENL